MTMIDPFTHDQNLDNYSLLFGGTTYDDDDDGMSRLEEGYECNYANKSFILTDIDNNNNLVDFPMADHHDDHREGEEESRRTAAGSGHGHGSTSKDLELQDAAGGSWLRLGLGRHVTDNPRDNAVDPTSSSSVIRPAAGLLELTLLPAGTTTPGVSQSQPSMILMSAPNPNLNPSNYNSLMFQQQQQQQSHGLNYNYYSSGAPTGPRHPHHQDLNFVFRPTLLTPPPHPHDNNNNNIPFRNFQSLAAASSSSNYNFPPTTSGSNNYFTAVPFQQLRPTPTAAAGPSFDFRVISPPRRPHSGLWFILQASQTQSKEPFLPQLPKSYLRIKDGRMTVRMLIKYLLNKLKLDSESEIEIRCKGQQLVPFLTLQYVRDNIWRSKDISATTVSSSSIPRDSSSSSTSSSPANLTTDHVMLLHYSRTT